MSSGKSRLRSFLDTAVTAAAIGASLFAVGVVILLVWWVRSLSGAAPQPATFPTGPRSAPPQAAARAPRSLPAVSAPAPPPVRRVAVPATAPPTAVPSVAVPARRGNDDAAKNRALGAALSRLADDPELQRKLEDYRARSR